MMSLPGWLSSPMFIPGGSLSLVPCSFRGSPLSRRTEKWAIRILLVCFLVARHFSCQLRAIVCADSENFFGRIIHYSYWNFSAFIRCKVMINCIKQSLLPATKLGQGYVFTGVCDSVNVWSTSKLL